MMKKWVLGSLALSLLATAGSASAADLSAPVYKAPVAAPPPPYNWTGLYVGGSVGYGWGLANDDIAVSAPTNLGGTATLAASDSHKVNGVIGGGQIGHNWNFRPILLGLEADIQGSGQTGNVLFSSAIITDPTTLNSSARLDWFGTVRGRAGIIADRWLFYVTGGLAYGKVNQSGSVAIATALAPFPNPTLLWNNSGTNTGSAIGGGIENALSSSWTWKLEYLYMDLGSVTAATTSGPGNFCFGTPGVACSNSSGPVTASIRTKFTDNIVRFGVNYKFGN